MNSEATIRDSLGSLENQSYPNLEIVVVDGGSVDRTVEFVASSSGRIRILQTRLGRTSARLAGVEASRGEYVFFMDGDQRAEPELVAECVTASRASGKPMVKVPETIQGRGLWFGCRSLDLALTQCESLSYPRFFRRDAYLGLGRHSIYIEDFMEDRELFLRACAQGVGWTWVRARLVNLEGAANPVQIGLRRYRAARDSDRYYAATQSLNDSLGRLIGDRCRAFLTNLRNLGDERRFLPLLPAYYVMAYGPRLARVASGRVRPGQQVGGPDDR